MEGLFKKALRPFKEPKPTELEQDRRAEVDKIIAEISEMKDRPKEGKEMSSRGVLLAPDGTPSLLRSEFIWKFVRTPTFKKLFGDWESSDAEKVGKLMDEHGEPMLFVHGSSGDFFPLRRRRWIQKKFFRASKNLPAEKKMDVVNFTTNAAMATYYGERLNFCFVSAKELVKINPPASMDDLIYAEPEDIREKEKEHVRSYKHFKKSADSAGVWDQDVDKGKLRQIGVLKVQDRRTIIPVPSPRLDAERVQQAREKGKEGRGTMNISEIFPQIEITAEDSNELRRYIDNQNPPFIVSEARRERLIEACLQAAKAALENGGDPTKDGNMYGIYFQFARPKFHEYWPTNNEESYISDNPAVVIDHRTEVRWLCICLLRRQGVCAVFDMYNTRAPIAVIMCECGSMQVCVLRLLPFGSVICFSFAFVPRVHWLWWQVRRCLQTYTPVSLGVFSDNNMGGRVYRYHARAVE